jgi:hypothetical protein
VYTTICGLIFSTSDQSKKSWIKLRHKWNIGETHFFVQIRDKNNYLQNKNIIKKLEPKWGKKWLQDISKYFAKELPRNMQV